MPCVEIDLIGKLFHPFMSDGMMKYNGAVKKLPFVR